MTSQQSCSLPGVVVSYGQAAADNTVLIVDARSAREYAAGHMPGAVSLPLADVLGTADGNGLCKVFGDAGITNDARCVFYDDAYGAVASRVAMALESVGGGAGLLDVTYSVWKEGHTPSTKPRVLEAAEFAAHEAPAEGILADIGGVKRVTEGRDGAAGGILLDARERLNYLSGHIPGAVNMPYHMFRDLENGKVLREPADLRRIFENRGLLADRPARIITYCGSAGTLSGLVYYALRHAGFTDVRMYANSFREWTADGGGRAVETQEDATYWDLSAE